MSGQPIDLVASGHLNLIEFSRESTRWGKQGSYHETPGALYFASGSWIPVGCNGAFRWDDGLPAARLVEEADDFFRSVRRGFSIKVRTLAVDEDLVPACEQAGIAEFGDGSPQMGCETPVECPGVPAGIELRTVATPEELADFAAVNAGAYATYQMPADTLPDFFSDPDAFLATEQATAVVAYAQGRAVAAALVYLSHGVAGVYWVGTVPEARSRGLGGLVTAEVTNRAFDRGAGGVTLQASPMGRPVYERLGYRTLYHYRDFVRWMPLPRR